MYTTTTTKFTLLFIHRTSDTLKYNLLSFYSKELQMSEIKRNEKYKLKKNVKRN